MTSVGLWLTPLILLPGVALLVLSTSIRYGQIHSEFHHLLKDNSDTAKTIARHLLARSILFRNALFGLYISVGFFSIASLIGGVASMFARDFDLIVVALTFVGILGLVFASVELIQESVTSLRIIREHAEQVRGGEH
ncbi:MAG: DUF2721 domain-containing protein [Anaerolineae bacterium]